ncbi:hypothetical protein ACLB2K_066635 [Fragaria x ananassa]
MAAIPDNQVDAAGNVNRLYMVDINAAVRGYTPIVALAVSQLTKSNLVRAIEYEIQRVVEDANEEVTAHILEIKGLAARLGSDLEKEKRRELEANDALLAAKDTQLARKVADRIGEYTKEVEGIQSRRWEYCSWCRSH